MTKLIITITDQPDNEQKDHNAIAECFWGEKFNTLEAERAANAVSCPGQFQPIEISSSDVGRELVVVVCGELLYPEQIAIQITEGTVKEEFYYFTLQARPENNTNE